MDKREAKAYIDRMRYIPARDQWCCRGGDTRWIVLHSIEGPEGPNSAENCANYFANPGNRTASTQFCVDQDSSVRCAGLDMRVAGAVGANSKGLHIEQAGYAGQTEAEWNDPASRAMVLGQTAPLVAALCVLYDLPIRFVDANGLKRGDKGVTTHEECYRAFGGDVRSDPGRHYPLHLMLTTAQRIAGGTIPQEDEVTDDDVAKIVAGLVAALKPQLSPNDDMADPTKGLRSRVDQAIVELRAHDDHLTEQTHPNDPRDPAKGLRAKVDDIRAQQPNPPA